MDALTKNVLFLSVGGSPKPLKTSIVKIKPDRVVFVTSDGSDGTPSSRGQIDDLRTTKGFPNDFHNVSVPPDDLDRALALIESALSREVSKAARVTVDYTGGTKSMTAAMVLAATSHDNVRLQFMVGKRHDLVSVKDRTEQPSEIPVALVGLSQSFTTVRSLVSRRNFGPALSVLSSVDRELAKRELKGRVPKAWRTKVVQWQRWTEVLDLWDRFDHAKAIGKIESGLDRGDSFAQWFQEEGVVGRLEKLAHGKKKPTPEIVEDLWLNACRRGDLGLYDDAVARLYRLMEAVVQTHLFVRHGILTKEVPTKIIPKPMLEKYPQWSKNGETVQLALAQSKDLLSNLEEKGNLLELMGYDIPEWQRQRNSSILAHGFTPLGKEEWKSSKEWFMRRRAIWEDLLGRPTAEQLPNQLPNFS